jgi:hypothetical protein
VFGFGLGLGFRCVLENGVGGMLSAASE